MIVQLLIVAAVVFGINVLPAFAPPTWTVLVYFRFRYGDIPVPALILVGAGAATAGRFVLARAFGVFGRKLPAERTESLEVLDAHWLRAGAGWSPASSSLPSRRCRPPRCSKPPASRRYDSGRC